MNKSRLPNTPRASTSSTFCCWDCYFPHGELPILLIALTAAAFTCSLTGFFGSTEFVCIEYDINTPQSTPALPNDLDFPIDLGGLGIPNDFLDEWGGIELPSVDTPSIPVSRIPEVFCVKLRMASKNYWYRLPKEVRGWASGIRAAAFFAIVAATLAGATIALLSVSSCSPIAKQRIRFMTILLGAAALSQILTMSACATDICQLKLPAGTNTNRICEKGRSYLMHGGVAAVLGIFLYIGAAFVAFRYYKEVAAKEEETEDTRDPSSQEEKELFVHHHRTSPHRSKKHLKTHDLERRSSRRKMAPPIDEEEDDDDEEEEEFDDLEM